MVSGPLLIVFVHFTPVAWLAYGQGLLGRMNGRRSKTLDKPLCEVMFSRIEGAAV